MTGAIGKLSVAMVSVEGRSRQKEEVTVDPCLLSDSGVGGVWRKSGLHVQGICWVLSHLGVGGVWRKSGLHIQGKYGVLGIGCVEEVWPPHPGVMLGGKTTGKNDTLIITCAIKGAWSIHHCRIVYACTRVCYA